MTTGGKRPRVVIAGGGVGAVEALLGLRALAGDDLEIEIVAPNPSLTYRPLRVTEPFDVGEVRRFGLDRIAADKRAAFRHGALTAVEPETRRVRFRDGEWSSYDFLIVATGARSHNIVPGALPFWGPGGTDDAVATLKGVRAGRIGAICFALPEKARWPLPLYELAMLTAWRLAEEGLRVPLTFVTPEQRPLELFGPEASERVERLLSARGIEFRPRSRPLRVADGRLQVAGARPLPADRTFTLPAHEGPRMLGLPWDADGFICVDDHCRVRGLDDVFAVGDGADFPVKQGGLATQQADVAAACIAARLRPDVSPEPFRPVLRAALLTGAAPLYLRASLGATEVAPDVSLQALWWPPGKIAGRYLSPYLLELEQPSLSSPPLEDRERIPSNREQAVEADHAQALALALRMADEEAGRGEHWRAVGWLDAAERLNGVLPPEYIGKRRGWRGTPRAH